MSRRGEEEVEALVINEASGVYSGDTDPWLDSFDYPPGSIYITQNGVYQLLPGSSGPSTTQSDWELVGGNSLTGNLRICLFGGGHIDIPIQQSSLQVCLYGGGSLTVPLS